MDLDYVVGSNIYLRFFKKFVDVYPNTLRYSSENKYNQQLSLHSYIRRHMNESTHFRGGI